MTLFHLAAAFAIAGLILLIAATVKDVYDHRIKHGKRGQR